MTTAGRHLTRCEIMGRCPTILSPKSPSPYPKSFRQVGHRTYQRGAAYQRNREVVRYSYDEGQQHPHRARQRKHPRALRGDDSILPPRAGSAVFAARCTCPVVSNCKHAVALMLTALDPRLRGGQGPHTAGHRPARQRRPRNQESGAKGRRVRGKKLPASAPPQPRPPAPKQQTPKQSRRRFRAPEPQDPLAALRASGALTVASRLPSPGSTEATSTAGETPTVRENREDAESFDFDSPRRRLPPLG